MKEKLQRGAESETGRKQTKMAESSSLKTKEKILPYQFEPQRETDEEDNSDSSWETIESDEEVEGRVVAEERNKMDADSWCKCTHCQKQYLSVECICCQELEESVKLTSTANIGCIIDHEDFVAVCLNKGVLWTALVNLADREDAWLPSSRKEVPMGTYRYASYRQYIWWVHERLGRHVRRVIPSCVVSRIRAEFEEESGDYTTFKGTDEVASEIINAMQWSRIEED